MPPYTLLASRLRAALASRLRACSCCILGRRVSVMLRVFVRGALMLRVIVGGALRSVQSSLMLLSLVNFCRHVMKC